jgi:transcriptional regulator with XRE-family HTH domain
MDSKSFSNVMNKALRKWRIDRINSGNESISIDAFAKYLNSSQSTISTWLNGNSIPRLGNLLIIIPKLAEILGPSVYKELGILRPDPTFNQIRYIYDTVSEEEQSEIIKIIREFADQRGYQVGEQLKQPDQENEP